MPTHSVKLAPGVSIEQTPSLNQGAFQTTNQIRFAPSGIIEKIGGWTKFFPYPIDSIVRQLHPWVDLNGTEWLGVGAVDSLDVITGSALRVITPEENTSNNAPNFSTVNTTPTVTIVDTGSNATIYDVINIETQISIDGLILFGVYPVATSINANSYTITAAKNATSTVTSMGAVATFQTTANSENVTVVLNGHGLSVGDTYPVVVPITLGGVTISGFYTVFTVVDGNTFTINLANQATSNAGPTSQNSGNARILYYVAIGPQIPGTGYGVGPYGAGGYGSGVTPPALPGAPITVTDWTLDNWGGYLLASPHQGPIFVWQPLSGFSTAQIIPNAPTINNGIFVAMPAQILVAFGSSVLGIQDPLLINWSTIGNYNIWAAAVTNQAGSFRIPRGSLVVGGTQGPQYAIIWTDIGVWSMSYIGAPLVFGFNELGAGCGLISQFAYGTLGGTVYWMSQKQFFALPSGGSVTPVPCSVWDFIFQTVDQSNLYKIRCAPNSQFGEIAWHFPVTGGSGENTAYVKFTPALNAWDYGFNTTINIGRSAWIDQSVLGAPIGADPVSLLIYQHETSNDGDGKALTPSFSTGYWALGDGEDMMTNDLVMPDFIWNKQGASNSATVNVSFSYANYAQSTVYNTVNYPNFNGNPSFFRPMVRGRLMSMTVSSNDMGTWWRLGGIRIRTAFDGQL
jgi:hypothetical protein